MSESANTIGNTGGQVQPVLPTKPKLDPNHPLLEIADKEKITSSDYMLDMLTIDIK